jgi:hypothetical protein
MRYAFFQFAFARRRPKLAVMILLLLAACAGAPHAGAGDESEAAGERLYRSHCAACHRLRSPSEQTREGWARAVERFGPRAHLSEPERQLVLKYLKAHAADAAQGG